MLGASSADPSLVHQVSAYDHMYMRYIASGTYKVLAMCYTLSRTQMRLLTVTTLASGLIFERVASQQIWDKVMDL